MKVEFFPSPCGDDVLLKMSGHEGVVLARHELQELKVAIEEFQEDEPFRVAREATGK